MIFVLALCFGVLSTIVLMLFSVKYYLINSFYLSLVSFLDNVKLNLNFIQLNIHELINKENYNNYVFQKLLNDYQSYLNTKDEKNFAVSVKSIKFLSVQENETILNYFLKLGHSDSETETRLTDNFLIYANEKLMLSKQNVNKKAILIQKLAIILGVAVTIILL